jgi:hypothetical protein
MQLNENEESGGVGGDDDDSDDGEGGEGGGRKAAGPWKMPSTQEANENDSDEEEAPPGEYFFRTIRISLCGMWNNQKSFVMYVSKVFIQRRFLNFSHLRTNFFLIDLIQKSTNQ